MDKSSVRDELFDKAMEVGEFEVRDGREQVKD